MGKRRSRTLSFSDEEWAAITAGAQIAGFNRSVYIAQLAKADLANKPISQVEAALASAGGLND